LTKLCVTKCL